MADVTVKHIDELDSYEGRGRFLFARRGLGVTSFGMNVGRWPAGYDRLSRSRPREGRARGDLLRRRGFGHPPGGRRGIRVDSRTFARVGPSQKRKLVPGDDGVTLLALGGKPGAFEAHA